MNIEVTVGRMEKKKKSPHGSREGFSHCCKLSPWGKARLVTIFPYFTKRETLNQLWSSDQERSGYSCTCKHNSSRVTLVLQQEGISLFALSDLPWKERSAIRIFCSRFTSIPRDAQGRDLIWLPSTAAGQSKVPRLFCTSLVCWGGLGWGKYSFIPSILHTVTILAQNNL